MFKPLNGPRTLTVALAYVIAGACGSAAPAEPARPAEPAKPTAPAAPREPKMKRELLVLAASSLTDAFKALEREHEATHPDIDVLLSFAGSSAVTLQIEQGTGDVLATASQEHMQKLAKAGVIQRSSVFAHNELVVAVAPGNPAKIRTFADLASAERIVLGAPNVPVGRYADALLERAGKQLGAKFSKAVNARVVSREANVRLVLAKVELGEADAAIVYGSDIRQPECKPQPPGAPPRDKACEHVQAIEIPAALSERATYPIGVAARAKEPVLARAFIEHVLSPEGQALLAEHGFVPARLPLAAAQPEP